MKYRGAFALLSPFFLFLREWSPSAWMFASSAECLEMFEVHDLDSIIRICKYVAGSAQRIA